MSERDLIAANDAFYQAFTTHDAAAMEALWASDGPIACIHPGWGALNERRRIIESWRAIFDSPQAPAIICLAPNAFLFGDVGFVICFEQIGDTCLIATNVFARRDGAWKMVHHQAGPTSTRPDAVATGAERLH
ncbi:MAG: nuclear transport factor 2 family protein [Dongiaceae bacterium]